VSTSALNVRAVSFSDASFDAVTALTSCEYGAAEINTCQKRDFGALNRRGLGYIRLLQLRRREAQMPQTTASKGGKTQR
jgi:hypothetical protein